MNPIFRKPAALLTAAVTAGLLATGAAAAQAPAAHGWCSLNHDHACHVLCTLDHDHALDTYCWLCHDHAQGCWNGYWGWYSDPDSTVSSVSYTGANGTTSGVNSTGSTDTGVTFSCPWGYCPGYCGGHRGGGHHHGWHH